MVTKSGDENENVAGSSVLEMLQQEHPDALATLMEELGDDDTVVTEFVEFFAKRQAKKEGRESSKVAIWLFQNDKTYAKAWTGVQEDATKRVADGFDLDAAKKEKRTARSEARKTARAEKAAEREKAAAAA